MAEEYTNASPRQELEYVSTKDSVATVLGAASNIFNTIGDYTYKKGLKLQKEQEEADGKLIQNTALKMQQEFESSFMQDGNYNEFYSRKKEYNENFVDNLKENLGGKKDKAVDNWYKKHGENFMAYSDYSYSMARDKAYEAINKTSVDNEMNLYANTAGGDFEGLLKAGSDVYNADADNDYHTNNPSNPTSRQDTGYTLFTTNAKSAIEKMRTGEIRTASGGYFTEDEAVEYIMNGGDDGWHFNSYNGQHGWDGYKSFVSDGFTNEYMANPSNVGRDSYMAAVESTRGEAEKAIRAAFRADEEEQAIQVSNKMRNYNNQIALDYLRTGTSPNPEEIIKEYQKQGLDTSNPIVIADMAANYANVKKRYEEADSKRTAEINSILTSEDSNIDLMVASGGKYYTQDSYTVYSDSGKIDNLRKGNLNQTTEAFIANTFVESQREATGDQSFGQGGTSANKILKAEQFLNGSDGGSAVNAEMHMETTALKKSGKDEIGIATPYGGVVEEISAKYGITDPREKMMIASAINAKFPTGVSYSGDTSESGVPAGMTDYGQGWEIISALYSDRNNYTNDQIIEVASRMYNNSELTDAGFDEIVKNTKSKRNTPMDLQLESMINTFKEAAKRRGYTDAQLQSIFGINTTMQKTLSQWLQNNPNATSEEKRRYCEDLVGFKVSEDCAKELEKVFKSAFKEFYKSDSMSLDPSYNALKNIRNRQAQGSSWFIQNNPSGISELKRAIYNRSYSDYGDFKDFAANAFFGSSYEDLAYDDLDETQQALLQEAIGAAMIDVDQYMKVRDVAEASSPSGKRGNDHYREVRFDDCSIGIMDRAGFVYRTLGGKTKMSIGRVSTSSDEYKAVFSADYQDYAAYSTDGSQMIAIRNIGNWTEYRPQFFVDEPKKKSETVVFGMVSDNYRSQDIIDKPRIKKDKDVGVNDFRNDRKLLQIRAELMRK